MRKKTISAMVILTLVLTMAVPLHTIPSFGATDQVIVNIRADSLDYKEKRDRYAFDVVASHDGKIAACSAETGSKMTAEDVRRKFSDRDFVQIKKGQEATVFTQYPVDKGKRYDFYLLFVDAGGKKHGPFSFKNVEAKYFPMGRGMAGDPYQIWTPRQLFNMESLSGKKENANVKLMQNLDLTGHSYEGSVMGFAASYYGTLDGNQKVIKGMTGALMGELKPGGMIHDLHIGNSKVSNSAIFVRDNYGTIKECSVANVELHGGATHGIGIFAGYNYESGIVKNCAANALTQLFGDDYMGTIAGRNYGLIDTCAARSDIIGNCVGGIAGRNDSQGRIVNCGYNGTVLNGSYRGGITGHNNGAMVNNISAWRPVDPYEGNSGSVAGRYSNKASAANFGAVKLMPDFLTDENGNENPPHEQQRLINDWLCRHGIYKGASDWISPIWYAVTWNFSAQIWQPYNLGSLVFLMHTAETIEYNQLRPFTQFTGSGGGTPVNPGDPKPPVNPGDPKPPVDPENPKPPAPPENPDDPGEAIDVIQAVNANSSSGPVKYQSETKEGEADTVTIQLPKAGTLLIQAVSKGNESSIDMELAETGGRLIDSTTVSRGGQKTWAVPLAEGGKYRLKIAGHGTNCRLHFTVTYAPFGGTLTRGVTYHGSSPKGDYAYYKVTAPKTGYFTIRLVGAKDGSHTYVRLLDSTERVLSYQEPLTSSTRYGVKKGTYYIAIKSSSQTYGVNVTLTSVTESKAGAARNKAPALSKGSAKKGIITCAQSSKSVDWYRFTIKKSQKVYLDVTTRVGKGALRISVYKSGKTADCGAGLYDKDYPAGTIMPYTSKYTKKLSAGTYYIKVQKHNLGNGYYKIKWLK